MVHGVISLVFAGRQPLLQLVILRQQVLLHHLARVVRCFDDLGRLRLSAPRLVFELGRDRELHLVL